LWGLTGIGIAFIIDYVLEGALIWYVCYKKFSFQFTKEFVSIFIVVFLFCLLSICISFVDNNLIKYVLDTILFIGSIIYAFCELNKRIGFLSLLRKSK
jgi:PST family polysaccharide transporter